MHDAELGRDDEAASRMLLRVPNHALGAEDVCAVRVDVAARLEVHALAGAAAFWMDEQVRIAVLAASAIDVVRPDARVNVALSRPDVHGAASHLLEVGAEKHVGQEQDLFVLRDRPDHPLRVAGGAAVIAEGFDLGGGVDVGHDDRTGMLGLPCRELSRIDRGGERAAGLQVWDQHPFGRAQDHRGLRHEVHSAEHDHVGVGRGRLP